MAFFPDQPATPGHTLVIPRLHVPELWSADPELVSHLMVGVLQVGSAIRKALSPEGMNLISSSGAKAEQSVYHLHLHVVPRYEGDRIDPIWPSKQDTGPEIADRLADRIRESLTDT